MLKYVDFETMLERCVRWLMWSLRLMLKRCVHWFVILDM